MFTKAQRIFERIGDRLIIRPYPGRPKKVGLKG